MAFLWVIFSYILGSFPSGYLISRWSGKDILKIGWRKTSGSNVFKNIGKWQGALTGILDVLKGYAAVYGAQKLGLSLEIQIFSGVAAVTGHNWSCFLKFAGGRGIGTFIGAFFALSPKILGLSLIPFALLALIWNAAIGTLLFLAAAISLSVYFDQFEVGGIFTLLALAPILIKRLSPIGEIPQTENPAILFRNRLIFDDDQASFDLRIKRIFKKNPGKFSLTLRSLASPFLLPSKIGWKTAKFGAKIAKKPIEKLFFVPEKRLEKLGIEELKNLMIASAKKVVFHQEEINKINVFPVADKDTGYNLAATLLGIEGVISQKKYSSIRELAKDIKEAAMTNARGNAGMIYTGYLTEVLDRIKHLEFIDAFRLSFAMRRGIRAAYHSIFNPVEGTILDVIKVSGEKAYQMTKIKKEKNIIKILEEAQKVSEIALKETKEKLEVLKQNDVVDAGALGFVKILEAWLESLKGINQFPEEKMVRPGILEPKTEEGLEYQYDLVFRIKKNKEEQLKKLKNELSQIGGSIDVIEGEKEIKFHIHTNLLEKAREKVEDFEILDWKVEDMAAQVRKITEKKPLGIIVGESADLPREFLEKNQISEIPFLTKFPNGEVLKKEDLFLKLKEAVKTGRPLPTASAPSFRDFLSGYQRALEQFEEVLVITLSGKLSGTYSSARIGRSMLEEKQRVAVFDCFTAGVGEGLVAFKIQELISQGKRKKEILEILKKFCPEVKLIGGLKDFSYLVRSGRVRLPKIAAKIITLFSKIGLRFLFAIKEGKVRFCGLRFGQDLAQILVREIEKEQRGRDLKLAIAYGDNLKEALELKKELEKKEKIKILFLSQVSAVVGVYTGPGVLIVGSSPA